MSGYQCAALCRGHEVDLPRVSVNIPCYNSERFIARTIQSVLGQTYTDFELVVLDDGSKDKTRSIVQEFHDARIRYHYQPNMGLGRTRNRLIELSQGEMIAFLDHDDIWQSTKLEKQVALFDKKADLGLVYSSCNIVYPDGKEVSDGRFRRHYRGFVFNELLRNHFIVLSSVLVKKSILCEFNGFPDYQIAEERALFLKIASKHPFDYVEEPLTKYVYHAGNLSRNVELGLKEELEIFNYWNAVGDRQTKGICRQGMAQSYLTLGRKLLLTAHQRQKARSYFAESVKLSANLSALFFYLMTLIPIEVTLKCRNVVLSLWSKKN